MHVSSIKHLVLSKIYALRVMSYTQIYEYIFKENNQKQSSCEETVKKMVAEGLLEKDGTTKQNAKYFLTNAGIKILKTNGIIPIGSQTPIMQESYHTAAKIKIKKVYYKHQLALNDFVLEFERRYKGRDIQYLDELYISTVFSSIRPDGLLRLDNTFYFLEMDMNTERKQRLNSKWINYKQFVRSSEFNNIKLNIKVLFILGGNVGTASARVYNLRSYIMENISHLLSPKFDVLINTQNNLLRSIMLDDQDEDQVKDIFTKKDFSVSPKNFTDQSLSGYIFSHYVLMLENNKVKMQDGISQEFLVDDFTDGSMYTMQKINMYHVYNEQFNRAKNRDIKYIVICNSEYDALKTEAIFIAKNMNVYYTTHSRLAKFPTLQRALFKISSDGESYHFDDSSFKIAIYEGKISNELQKKRGW